MTNVAPKLTSMIVFRLSVLTITTIEKVVKAFNKKVKARFMSDPSTRNLIKIHVGKSIMRQKSPRSE